MKILWTHNFSPDIQNSGIFMKQIADSLKNQGIHIEMLYLGNLRSVYGLFKAIIKIRAASKNFDLTHAQFGSACGFVSMFALNKKIISLRGSDWHKYNGDNLRNRIHNFLSRIFTKLSINSYDKVIVMSKKMKNELEAYSKKRILADVITDPIDLNLFKPKNKIAEKKNKKYILFTTIDKSNPIKRVSLALESVNRVKNIYPSVEIKIASGIDHKDMPDFVSSCDLVLCTSHYEGWPNSVKEALACGIPFVSTDVSDLSDIAKKRESCRISDPNPESISNHIIDVLKLQKEENLHDEVFEMSMEKISSKIIKSYNHLIQNL